MKKVISMLLTLTLLLSFAAIFAVQTGAEEAAETAKAPVFYGFQLTAPADNKQNIRFVSVLTSLEGDAVGYKITADYLKEDKSWTKTMNYEQETTQVYASLLANNAYGAEAVTATALAAELKLSEGKGLLALVIEDVPTNIGEITFTVETYVKNGDKTVTSDESYFIVENGVKSSKKVLFREDYNDLTTSSGVYDTFNSQTTQCALKMDTAENGGGNCLAPNGWYGFQILDGACLNGADHYTIEFDAMCGSGNNAKIMVLFNASFPTSALQGINGFGELPTGSFITRFDLRPTWASLSQVNQWTNQPDTRVPNVTKNGSTAQHFAIELDKSGDKFVVTLYVNGVLIGSSDKIAKGSYNDIYLYGDNPATFDNLKVTEGAYLTQKAS